MNVKRVGVILLVLVVCFPLMAWADGDSRKVTPAEKKYLTELLTGLNSAIPAPFQGWEEISRDEVKAPEFVGTDEKTPLSTQFSVEWQDPAKKQAFQVKIEALGEKMANDPEVRKQGDEVQAKADAISTKMGAAIERGDNAEVERLQKEMEFLGKQLETQGSAMENSLKTLEKDMNMVDANLRVTLAVNSSFEDLTSWRKDPPIEGFPVYFRPNTPEFLEERLMVFLGSWKVSTDVDNPGMQAEFSPSATQAKTQTIVIRLNGSKTRALEFLKILKWSALKGLL